MKIILSTFFCAFMFSAKAQQDSIEVSPLKFIGDKEYAYYTKGNDPSLVLIAELNNYPSPQKVLDKQKQLNLSTDQKIQIQTIHTEMMRKIKEMGGFLITEQTKLNKLFETNKVNEGSLIYHTNKIGALEGEMRNAYLKAHLRTRGILTAQQLKKYDSIKNTNK
ncbi:hypothetical protein Pedsa_2668 [Pseudopedobacter saltans DSM 12145]|uniref:DUF4252 domain-containing protein n=1 Tax=Pseudopedobacter saltans (strain ATCC 51119 / DSM 12145 / JCM 21818 / CCUG 39354 / LMG 10337 / NBRC 100064 / NCIMB 13643) TaxID=762903 RepID=F0S696_PSESL|nr:hypothetical protein [Pseudopedobacter saltans]ADY53210.1 hypothetical protein Pedsa_2668 [Pseudopedobacter saltans DSM 12145]